MGKKGRRVYDREFKQAAVKLVESGERSSREVAESLGVHESQLSRWVKSLRTEGSDAFRGNGRRTAVEEEIWRLKLKNKELEREIEFLKKVSRYFAKDPK